MDAPRVRLLQAMPVFGGVSAAALDALLRDAAVVERAPGTYFFGEGDAADGMYVLEHGRVAVVCRRNGRDRRLRELCAGDCFGEMALIDLQPRSASVLALEPCVALRLTEADLYRVYETDAEQFALIQMNLARELSRRLRLADVRALQADTEDGAPRGPTIRGRRR